MKQLAQRYSCIDLERAGIYGHSGGGYAAAAALLSYPDFFKVGISESGNHDQLGYTDDWGEKFIGLLERNPDGETTYDRQDTPSIAKNLKAHLLLMHGTMDDNVPPYLTLLLVVDTATLGLFRALLARRGTAPRIPDAPAAGRGQCNRVNTVCQGES